MDSICKNVGPVYTLSPEDRERFRKVVNTWKLPDVKTGGRAPLFDPALTRNLDTGYSNGVNNGRGLALSLPVVQPPPNQSLTSIQAVLLNPQDTASRSQIPVLTQLLVHVSTSILSTADLQLISQSLTSMMATTNSLIPTPSLPPVSLPKIMPGLLEGFNSKLSLSNADINKPLPNAHLILYDPSTNQCAQCGTRFPGTTDAGKKKYSAHLDWHFRQNKRLRENTRRRVCREWWLANLTGNLEVDEDKSCESMSDPGFLFSSERGILWRRCCECCESREGGTRDTA
ncbi:hypothetical protein BCR33DRAFT_728748 [Rhizoclosmatium globosum]|uniref:CID domain-containing protein n=1 Tax=Rhizoclosmatium globosum TaxID=329046 RepID=A0A1Y2AIS2_9FUNG|nr:hypothetical protein BCR33DRAFT_728748 [Rhizoclosmatium globosum]|eukprot:ORY22461.1 hypothetical protein BCR33DRAFT_728748 [Rhizoclosmatium globosum]